jgi:type I restriction enzyme S subunit
MKKGWTYKKLGDCINKIPKQRQVKSKDYLSSGLYPIVSQEKELVSGYWNDEDYLYKHDKPIIIFGDHTKEIKYIDFDFVVGADGTQILQPKDDIDSRFFYYALLATPIRSLGYARHFKLLKEKSFLIPKLTEQKRIVERLDAAFAQIDELKANAEKQLAEARALFQKSLAKAMEPKDGWEEKMLSEITEVKDGTHDSPRYVTDGIPFVTQKNITVDGFDLLNTKKISLEDHKKFYTRSNVEFGDIIIAMIGANRGMSCIVDTQEIFSIKNVGLIKKTKNINMRYLLYYLHSSAAYSYVLENSNGGAQEFIGLKGLRNFPIQLPSLAVQQRIVERLDSISENVRKYEEIQRKIIAECDALKQALLRQVFE